MEKLQIFFDCPGIPKMYKCFKHGNSIYFISDFAAGGPFEKFLRFNSKCIPQETIQFYVAQMVFILEFLHTRGLAHRDFKPENMVLTKEKHLQLIDFGTLHEYCENLIPEEMRSDIQMKNNVKQEMIQKKLQGAFFPTSDPSSYDTIDQSNNEGDSEIPSPFIASRGRLTTFCGTNDYLSPEMIQHRDCDMNGDLWALGCIIYQMNSDKTPFHSKQISYDALKEKILSCKYNFPPNMNEKAIDIVKKLIVLNPIDRIGGVKVTPQLTKQDVQAAYNKLKSHPFFDGIQWDSLYEQTPPMSEESFIRKPQKKLTAPPQQSLEFPNMMGQKMIQKITSGIDIQESSMRQEKYEDELEYDKQKQQIHNKQLKLLKVRSAIDYCNTMSTDYKYKNQNEQPIFKFEDNIDQNNNNENMNCRKTNGSQNQQEQAKLSNNESKRSDYNLSNIESSETVCKHNSPPNKQDIQLLINVTNNNNSDKNGNNKSSIKSQDEGNKSLPINNSDAVLSNNNNSSSVNNEQNIKIIFEARYYEKYAYLFRADVLVQAQEFNSTFALSVYEYTQPNKLRHQIIIDDQTELSLQDDRLIITSPKHKKRTFIDHKPSLASDLYLILKKIIRDLLGSQRVKEKKKQINN